MISSALAPADKNEKWYKCKWDGDDDDAANAVGGLAGRADKAAFRAASVVKDPGFLLKLDFDC